MQASQPMIKSTNSQKSKPKSRANKRQRNRRRNKQKSLNRNQNKASYIPLGLNTEQQRTGAEIWREAYVNALQWHGDHQTNFWRRIAESLQKENQMLRQQMHFASSSISGSGAYYETSDEDEEEESKVTVIKSEKKHQDDEVDQKYLEFLEVTLKHRKELRMKREAEAQESVDDTSETVEAAAP